ncbi:MAG TPA: type IV toxin-antitoxin system AbiEi family antitoxin, partial [Thermoanaerobaculia bacterium]|nr:type IV toxin-antitoxin system AbiEi family antitoxin [Thermoanaerobaculia bacterium]
GSRRLLRRDQLVRQWTEAYARTLEPALDMARFAEPSPKWWKHADLAPYAAQWGGETAAAILHRHLVPERTIIYAEKLPTRMVSQHRLKPDPDGPIVLRQRFWHFETEQIRGDIVPPLLVYADLVTGGDARSLEAARKIRDEYLD